MNPLAVVQAALDVAVDEFLEVVGAGKYGKLCQEKGSRIWGGFRLISCGGGGLPRNAQGKRGGRVAPRWGAMCRGALVTQGGACAAFAARLTLGYGM
jgi:hypothetical protein